MLEEAPRILVVEARFYDHLADALLEGALAALGAAGANVRGSQWQCRPECDAPGRYPLARGLFDS